MFVLSNNSDILWDDFNEFNPSHLTFNVGISLHNLLAFLLLGVLLPLHNINAFSFQACLYAAEDNRPKGSWILKNVSAFANPKQNKAFLGDLHPKVATTVYCSNWTPSNPQYTCREESHQNIHMSPESLESAMAFTSMILELITPFPRCGGDWRIMDRIETRNFGAIVKWPQTVCNLEQPKLVNVEFHSNALAYNLSLAEVRPNFYPNFCSRLPVPQSKHSLPNSYVLNSYGSCAMRFPPNYASYRRDSLSRAL